MSPGRGRRLCPWCCRTFPRRGQLQVDARFDQGAGRPPLADDRGGSNSPRPHERHSGDRQGDVYRSGRDLEVSDSGGENRPPWASARARHPASSRTNPHAPTSGHLMVALRAWSRHGPINRDHAERLGDRRAGGPRTLHQAQPRAAGRHDGLRDRHPTHAHAPPVETATKKPRARAAAPTTHLVARDCRGAERSDIGSGPADFDAGCAAGVADGQLPPREVSGRRRPVRVEERRPRGASRGATTGSRRRNPNGDETARPTCQRAPAPDDPV